FHHCDAMKYTVAGKTWAAPETVTPATPAINTTLDDALPICSVARLTDSATLSGGFTPTGTITFTLFLGAAVVDTEVVPVNGNGTYVTPAGILPLATGTYQWVAAYSGDANNNTVASNIRDEPETVLPVTPAINTIHGGHL